MTSLLAGLRLLSRFAWTPTSLCKALHVNLRRQGCEAGLSARWRERLAVDQPRVVSRFDRF